MTPRGRRLIIFSLPITKYPPPTIRRLPRRLTLPYSRLTMDRAPHFRILKGRTCVMPGRYSCGFLALAAALSASGCGGVPDAQAPAASGTSGSMKRVQFVGFDASPPLVSALHQGKLQGLVLQNPLRMGELGVKTMVDYLEKRSIERKVSTGETMATPENMDEPDVQRLLNPLKAENRSDAGTQGGKKWRIEVIPKGTTHEFWKTIHAGALKAADELGNVEVIWQGPVKEDQRSEQINLIQSAVAAGVDGIVLADR